jgi:hypothetical protein
MSGVERKGRESWLDGRSERRGRFGAWVKSSDFLDVLLLPSRKNHESLLR